MSLRPNIAGTALAVTIVIAASVALFLALRFAKSEATRDSLVWQRQMAVVINSREAAVQEWLNAQKKVISRLADNPSLRIYLGTVETAKTPSAPGKYQPQDTLAITAYLGNQLKAAALQNDYVTEVNPAFRVNANLTSPEVSGIALTNPRGRIIVSTPNIPPVMGAVKAYLKRGGTGDVVIFGPYSNLSSGKKGGATIAIIAPVFGVQEDRTTPAIGFAVGIKLLNKSFFQKLVQPGEISKTARNYLVRRNKTTIEYLSPLRSSNGDLNPPLSILLAANPASLAAAYAVKNAQAESGGFAERIDYNGRKVLVTGRKITGTDWVLVRTVASQEVLGAIKARERNFIWIVGLIILAVTIFILLVWRHGVSIRIRKAAERQAALTRKYEKLSHFLRIVTDSQPTMITAVDSQGYYTFANAEATMNTGISNRDIIGRKATTITSPLKSPKTEIYCHQVLEKSTAISVIEKLPENDKTIKSDYVPLPVDHQMGVLIVTEDISPLVQERERREKALKNLVNTLTMVIDSRDPYSARHSERVVRVTQAIANEMNVDDLTQETANVAGALMNLGKILVSRELLTRPGGLSRDELATVRSSIMKTADMLERVDFDGPVVMTLRQVSAHWDGSGLPKDLCGPNILLSARIVAVANAFVGMSSARAHRAGMDMAKAALLLLDDADRIYDRKAVTALMNYLENKNGLEKWQDFGKPLL
ncbi:MAG: PAS domain S-box protein [Alphaproteobacteria bacterium]|nr:PAS domain S-box protein [Alphaproteobacteria bacterium]